MTKQVGLVRIKGTLGDYTYYRSKDGDYRVREKTPVDAKRIATDPAFKRTRENNEEFGRAGTLANLVRTAFNGIASNAKDKRVYQRLLKLLMRIFKFDIANPHGKRTVIDAATILLEKFNFNENASLTSTLEAPYTATVARVSGELSLSIPPFNPEQSLKAPLSATHYKIVMGGTEINFTDQAYQTDKNSTGFLPYNDQDTILTSLMCNVPAASPHPLFITLGLEFYMQLNGHYYPLHDGSYNLLTIVKVDTPQ